MQRLFLFAVLVLVCEGVAYGQDCAGAQALKAHIYNPERLVPTEKGCITVTGKILAKVSEADGDFHYRLRLDRGQGSGVRG